MKTRTLSALLCLFAAFLILTPSSAQLVPVSFDQRVANSAIIAIVKLKDKTSYWDQQRSNIWTRNELEVIAYFKGSSTSSSLVAISPGGIVGNQAQVVCPSEKYEPNTEYLIFLKDDNSTIDDKNFRRDHPEVKQCLSYAGVQSLLPYQNDVYNDALSEDPMSEEQLVQRMGSSYGLAAKRPAGEIYVARTFNPVSPRTEVVTSITDGTGSLPASGFVNGTLPANNELIINGSGFGATTGSVLFPNINGAGFGSTVASVDIISWSDVQVRTKIPDAAGSGTLTVRDNLNNAVGTSPITVKWGEINVTSAFLNHASAQRQQVHLLNTNTLGGYTFEYSSNTVAGPSFFANTSAKESFARALITWRCNSLVNYNVSTVARDAGFAADGFNIVMYDDASLPAGALGVCASRFSASGTGGQCDLFNTVWSLDEMDIRVLTLPTPTTTWNYTTSAPTALEYDFESVMLHEIGHGHGLTHINLPATLMYFSIANGEAKRSPSANEIEAGQYRITVSNSNCMNTNGFPDFVPHSAIAVGSCAILLPVTLLDFSGQKRWNVIDLQWITESEINSRGYYIERSTDGQHFTSLGFVPSRGGLDKKTYTYTDNSRFASGIVHYRLRMVDNDDNFKYSKVIQFRTEPGSWKLFPNPATEVIHVVADKIYQRKTILTITDLAGRIVQTQTTDQLTPGNTIPIHVNKLPAGFYTLRIQAGDEILLIEKFTKQ